MITKEYNGWRNYETWNVALWLSNDQGTQEYWQERTREVAASAESDWQSKEEQAAQDLADILKDEIMESAPELGASMFSDLLGAALSEVDWYEIAQNWLQDLEPEDWKQAEEQAEDA